MGLSAGAAFLSRGGDFPAAQDGLGVADHDQDRQHLLARRRASLQDHHRYRLRHTPVRQPLAPHGPRYYVSSLKMSLPIAAMICSRLRVAVSTRNERGGMCEVPSSCQTAVSSFEPTRASLASTEWVMLSRTCPVSSSGVSAAFFSSVGGAKGAQPSA